MDMKMNTILVVLLLIPIVHVCACHDLVKDYQVGDRIISVSKHNITASTTYNINTSNN